MRGFEVSVLHRGALRVIYLSNKAQCGTTLYFRHQSSSNLTNLCFVLIYNILSYRIYSGQFHTEIMKLDSKNYITPLEIFIAITINLSPTLYLYNNM